MTPKDTFMALGGIYVLIIAAIILPPIYNKTAVNGPHQQFRMDMNVKPTGVPKPHPPINKAELIVQQNPECWVGVPGYTCQPGTRTYL